MRWVPASRVKAASTSRRPCGPISSQRELTVACSATRSTGRPELVTRRATAAAAGNTPGNVTRTNHDVTGDDGNTGLVEGAGRWWMRFSTAVA